MRGRALSQDATIEKYKSFLWDQEVSGKTVKLDMLDPVAQTPKLPVQTLLNIYFINWFYFESESEVTQSCPTFFDPMDCSLSGSSVHGNFQARVLERVAISFSTGSSWPRDQTQVSRIVGTLPSEPPGKSSYV